MKKIIAGRLYDTDTAKEIGWNGYSNSGDFHYWQETLYQKKTGEYFLFGEGGPASRYREQISTNGWRDGSVIRPLKEDEAKEWAMENMDADDYIEHFGPVDE